MTKEEKKKKKIITIKNQINEVRTKCQISNILRILKIQLSLRWFYMVKSFGGYI